MKLPNPRWKDPGIGMLFSRETVKLEDLCYLGFYFVFLVQWKKSAGLGMRRSSPNANCY